MADFVLGTNVSYSTFQKSRAEFAAEVSTVEESSGALIIKNGTSFDNKTVADNVEIIASNTSLFALGGQTISANTQGPVNVTASGGGVLGTSVTIDSGVYVWSDSTSNPAISIQENGVSINNSGYIMGKGGNGGGSGGPAIEIQAGVTGVSVINNANAYIGGGGGGGGGYGGGGGAGGGTGRGHTTFGGSASSSPGQGGAIGASGGNGTGLGGNGGTAGGGGGDGYDTGSSNFGVYAGGGGGRVFPGVGGAAGTSPGGFGSRGAGGAGGSAGNVGGNRISGSSGGGGGGWGAAGGQSGGAGGAAIKDNGETYTLTDNGTIYGVT